MKVTRAKVRTRHVPGQMNKTEAEYASVLEASRIAGAIDAWLFERFQLTLADQTTYRPDFYVVLPDGAIEFHEVKAIKNNGEWLWEPAARVKFKVAADQFPWFAFVAIGKRPKKLGGGFERKDLR